MLSPKRRPTVASAAALMLLSGLWGCGAKPAGPPPPGPPTVAVVTLQAQPVRLQADLPGRVSPFEVSEVRPQVTGIIQARLLTEGSDVRAGQLLYRIDPAPYKVAYDQAVAQLANARATLTGSKLKAERLADMVKINAVSRQDADDARAAYEVAAATVQQQAAAVAGARINLGYTRVTAPIAGRIGVSAVTRGALVTNGQANALATIQTLDPVYVDLTQTAAELMALRDDINRAASRGKVSAGASVRLQLAEGRDYALPGKLQFTDVTVGQNTGSVTLRAIFPNPRGELLPGMYVRARVIEGIDPAGILAPQQAVNRDEKGRATALVVDARGRAEARVLTVAGAVGSQWRVTAGLGPGDRLIVTGGANAHPGAPVRVVAGPAPAPAS